MKRHGWILAMASLAIAPFAAAQGKNDPPKLDISFVEKRLAVLPDVDNPSYCFSSDGRTVAFKTRQTLVVTGGKEPREFSNASRATFSTDGKSVAYVSRTDKLFVAVGDKKGPEFESMMKVESGTVPRDITDLCFSPDGTTLAYAVNVGTLAGGFVVVGDTKGEEFNHVSAPAFCPDGKTVWYMATKLNAEGYAKNILVVGGKKMGEEFETVGSVAFSPDGKTIAYAAQKTRRKVCVVEGDKKGEDFSSVEQLRYAPDGKTLAYEAVASDGPRRRFVVVGTERRGKATEEAHTPVFGPDSKTIAYVSTVAPNTQSCVVIGEKRGEMFDKVDGLTFSPDGKTLAYLAQRAERRGALPTRFVVIGEKKEELEGYSAVLAGPTFSPDGKTVAYVVSKGQKWLLVVGGKKSGEFDRIGDQSDWLSRGGFPVFSPDGRKVAFGARIGLELWWKVIEVKP
jgi:Tol biopolymer transport system component